MTTTSATDDDTESTCPSCGGHDLTFDNEVCGICVDEGLRELAENRAYDKAREER